MSDYTKTTNFAAKDSLPSGNSGKIVKGSEIDTEFTNIQTAVATKLNINDSALTGSTSVQTLTVSTLLDITSTTDASDATGDTGALRTEGGASIAKKLFVGTDLDVDGTTNLDVVDIDGAVNMASTALVTGVLTTTAATVHTNGITMPDNAKAIFGTGSDLEIYHDGSNSIISDQGTGNLVLRAGDFRLKNADSSETMILAAANGAVQLYYDNAAKLTTSSTGIDVTGTAVTDGLTVDGTAVITTDGNTTQLTLKSTDADASVGPRLDLTRDSASPAADDTIGVLRFVANDSADNSFSYAFIQGFIVDPTDGSEDGKLVIETKLAGANRERISMDATELVINESSQDLDFRIESDNNSHALFVQGSDGNVGIGTGSPTRALSVFGDTAGVISITSNSTDGISSLSFGDTADDNAGRVNYLNASDAMLFYTAATERMRIDAAGNFLVGKTSASGGIAGSVLAGSGLTRFTASGIAVAEINRLSSDGSIIDFKKDGTTVGSIASEGGDALVIQSGTTSGSGLHFHPTSALIRPARNGATIDAAINLGASTRRFKDLFLSGAISKGSGSFKIDHPLPAKTETHHLVHSFVEAPQADNIYRGKVELVDGSATVNIDTVAGMTEGTYVLLNTNTQCFTSNESGWTAVKGSVSGNTLTITAQENTCTDTISWMVVGERHDQHMFDTEWTDENGKVIVEPLKENN